MQMHNDEKSYNCSECGKVRVTCQSTFHSFIHSFLYFIFNFSLRVSTLKVECIITSCTSIALDMTRKSSKGTVPSVTRCLQTRRVCLVTWKHTKDFDLTSAPSAIK